MDTFEIKIHPKFLTLFSSCTHQLSISPELTFFTLQLSNLLPDFFTRIIKYKL